MKSLVTFAGMSFLMVLATAYYFARPGEQEGRTWPGSRDVSNEGLAPFSEVRDYIGPVTDAPRARATRTEAGRHNNVQQLLESLDDSDIPTFLSQFLRDDKAGERWQVRSALAKRWAETDPRAAMAFATSVLDDGRESLMADIISVWARKDANAALQWAEGLPATRARSEAFAAMARTWAHQDPEAALAYFADPARGTSPAVLAQLFQQWALDDPARASAALSREIPGGPRQDMVMRSVMASWAKTDPQSALAFASQLSSSNQRADGTAIALSEWADLDWQAVLDWSTKATGEARDRAELLAATARAKRDPLGALGMLESLQGSSQDGVQRTALRAWAQQDPESALEYARSLPNSQRSETLAGAVLEEWAVQNPATASQEIERMAPGSVRDRLVRQISQNWSEHDLHGSIEWMRGIEDPELQLTAAAVALPQWVESDPQGMASFLATTALAMDGAGVPLMRGVVSHWAKSDSQGALQWALQLTSGAARNEAVAASIEAWAQEDPAAAGHFTLSLPADEARQVLLAEIGTEWALQSPDSAMQWAQVLPDLDRDVVIGAMTTRHQLPAPPPGQAH